MWTRSQTILETAEIMPYKISLKHIKACNRKIVKEMRRMRFKKRMTP